MPAEVPHTARRFYIRDGIEPPFLRLRHNQAEVPHNGRGDNFIRDGIGISPFCVLRAFKRGLALQYQK